MLKPATLEVLEEETKRERQRQRGKRIALTVRRGGQPNYRRSVRTATFSNEIGARGFKEEDVVELVGKNHPCPLRVRALVSRELPTGVVVVDEEAARFFHLNSGDTVSVRALLSPQDTQ